MSAHALDRVVASLHVGDDGVVVVAVEPSAVADLAAGFGVERRVIEDDLAFVSGLEFLRALAVVDDGQHFAAVGASLAVAFEVGLRELLVGGIGGLLGCAFPGGAGAGFVLPWPGQKTIWSNLHSSLDLEGISNEILRQSERIVEHPRQLLVSRCGSD